MEFVGLATHVDRRATRYVLRLLLHESLVCVHGMCRQLLVMDNQIIPNNLPY